MGARFRTDNAFYKNFEAGDARSFKYVRDPTVVGEANEKRSVYRCDRLINQVLTRAKAVSWNTANFASKEFLIDSILAERGRKFFSEGLKARFNQRDASKKLEQNEG